MKEIILTQGKTAFVDDQDYDYLNQFNWSILPRRKNIYAVRGAKINGKYKTVLMHRDIMKSIPSNKEIDHIDRNGLNNQRGNLRIVTHSENLKNSRDRFLNKKLGMKKENNEWVVYIIENGEIKILKSFQKQIFALRDIKENKKYYLESV